MKICIDPGHGGKDPGAVSNGVKEKDLNLAIALKVAELLNDAGHQVHLTRKDDTFIPLGNIASSANNSGAGLFVSIHCNAFSNPTAQGFEVYHYPGNAKAQSVAAHIVSELGFNFDDMIDRGVKESGSLFVIKETRSTAVLVECGFVTNKQDRELLTSRTDDFGLAIASGIINAIK